MSRTLKKKVKKDKKQSFKHCIHRLVKAEIAKAPSKIFALKVISGQTGIGVPWLDKFVNSPDLYDPGLSKIETLHAYFYGISIREKLGEA